MKLRKLFLLMLAAVAAVAALAVPASASAAVWLHEGKPFEEHVEMNLSGGDTIEAGGNVLLCFSSSGTITTEGGSTGQLSYEVNPESCIGLAGEIEGCTATEVSTTGTPWTLHVNAEDVTATAVEVEYLLDPGCSVQSIGVDFPELTLVPEPNPEAFNLFRWSQAGPGEVDGEPTEVEYFGSLSLAEEELGTYGIG
jgi:hypothetical protein